MTIAVQILGLILFAGMAQAQQANCNTRDIVVGLITGPKFNERLVGAGIADAYMVETWANEATGTWTVTGTNPDGVTCIIAGGGMWTAEKPGDPA
jgi:hypothetical protein